jgi:hypothetical protein
MFEFFTAEITLEESTLQLLLQPVPTIEQVLSEYEQAGLPELGKQLTDLFQ